MSAERIGPNPWLVWVGSLVTAGAVSLVSGGVAWGKAEAQHVALERRVSVHDSEVERLKADTTGIKVSMAELAPEIRELRRAIDDFRADLRQSRR